MTLVVSPAGTPVVLSVTNGASLQTGAVSPGEIVTIFGNGIGPATPAPGTSFTPTASGTVPTTLAGVKVTFNNVPAPMIFVSPGQINAIVPYEVAGQTSVPVVVTNNSTTSAAFTRTRDCGRSGDVRPERERQRPRGHLESRCDRQWREQSGGAREQHCDLCHWRRRAHASRDDGMHYGRDAAVAETGWPLSR